ncbi:hypothetical protein LIER_39132 [Lithospermum erythrorhizon]|uniref:PB1 domain-containing protein n=1 Tax=Lithospermum erythrorhizon TaxID=34254 RepID=A0AAV3QDD0_LITER
MNNINNANARSVAIESAMADLVTSTPRSEQQTTLQRKVRFMCSFGGKIHPRPQDNQLRYVGGDTRILAIDRQANFTSLLSMLCKLCGTSDINVKYQLPNEDLDALITVSSDEDVENMMEEYDRLVQNQKSARLRLFLFPNKPASSRATSIGSFLNGSAKREQWFLDALNAGSITGSGLDRGRSEVSSVISDMPDYLFGLDQSDDPTREINLQMNKNVVIDENVSALDPGSPNPSLVNVLPDLPSIKTKLCNPVTNVRVLEANDSPVEEGVKMTEPIILNQTEYIGNSKWNNLDPVVQPVPVYYVPTQMQPATIRVPFVQPIQASFVQPYSLDSSQVPVGFAPPTPAGLRKVYGGLGPPPTPITRAISDGFDKNPIMYYGVRNAGLVPTYPNVIVSGGEDLQGSETDSKRGWVSQAP